MATKKKTAASSRFAQWAFVDMFVLFGVLFIYKPAIGMTGLGAVMVLGSLLVLANSQSIWDDYVASYKPSKSAWRNRLNEPKVSYYQINRYILCPLILVTGLGAILLGFLIGQ